MGQKKHEIFFSGDINNLVLVFQIDVVDCRAKVAVWFEFFSEIDEEVVTAGTFNDWILDESDFLGEAESGFVVVFNEVVVVFYL